MQTLRQRDARDNVRQIKTIQHAELYAFRV